MGSCEQRKLRTNLIFFSRVVIRKAGFKKKKMICAADTYFLRPSRVSWSISAHFFIGPDLIGFRPGAYVTATSNCSSFHGFFKLVFAFLMMRILKQFQATTKHAPDICAKQSFTTGKRQKQHQGTAFTLNFIDHMKTES